MVLYTGTSQRYRAFNGCSNAIPKMHFKQKGDLVLIEPETGFISRSSAEWQLLGSLGRVS